MALHSLCQPARQERMGSEVGRLLSAEVHQWPQLASEQDLKSPTNQHTNQAVSMQQTPLKAAAHPAAPCPKGYPKTALQAWPPSTAQSRRGAASRRLRPPPRLLETE